MALSQINRVKFQVKNRRRYFYFLISEEKTEKRTLSFCPTKKKHYLIDRSIASNNLKYENVD